MARRSEWLEQLPGALDELRRLPAPVIDRAVLERILRIHRRAAIRLMHRFNGFQSGKTFLIDRLHLIEQLERMGQGEEVATERVRRSRLTEGLEEARKLSPARRVRIEAAPDVRDRTIPDLPPGIHLKPGELRIDFKTAEDLLRQLFELSQAIVNDYRRFEKLCSSD